MEDFSRRFAGFKGGVAGLWGSFWSEGPRHLLAAIGGVLVTIENWLLDTKKARYGLAVTRILLGIAALGLWTTNFGSRYYTFGSGAAWTGQIQDPESKLSASWLFSAFRHAATNDTALTLLYLLTGALAVTVILGYRTRILLPLFTVMWVSLIEVQDLASDQGDNIFRIALIGLIFADPSVRWSLDALRRAKLAVKQRAGKGAGILARIVPDPVPTLAHNLVIVVLACQVIFVYVSGALYKAGGAPWRDGTAVYAPLQTVRFGPWPELSDLVTAWGPAVAIASIGSIIIQLTFPGALLFRWTRIPALFAMVGFHVGIAVLMGLPWFSLAMIAIDAIFIRDVTWERLRSWIVQAWRQGAGRIPEPSRPAEESDGMTDEKSSEQEAPREKASVGASARAAARNGAPLSR
ncbi:MAG: HTTM domain-containing protein [Micrococcaceae bacterium]|nr:HTTM domain-containing protein [Micrococcaceae bacterium]